MLIDSHCHVFPPSLAERAVAQLRSVSAKELQCPVEDVPISHDGTKKDLLNHMPRWGVDHCVLLNVATKVSQERTLNNLAVESAHSQGGEPVTVLGAVHPDSPDALSELERLHKASVRGIKNAPRLSGLQDRRF